MNEDKMIDQSVLAEDVSNKIPYDFVDFFLVKALDPIKVKKEFSKPVSKSEAVTDKNGVNAVDYDDVETEIKEVDSDFRKGVVLKVPFSYQRSINDTEHPRYSPVIKVGDIVLFREGGTFTFDLLKDSKLINSYSIIAICNGNN